MKKILLVLTLILSYAQMKADEGMWLLMLVKRLNYVDMQKEGLHLTPEEIYSVNNSSLKDAIVSFGGFCTGEIVSDKGLIFTNHHCGYDAVATASSPEKDYLKDGFWANDTKEEISSKGLYVRFLVRMDDVSARINAKLNNNMSAEERKAIIDAEYKAIQNENSENGKYTVVVKDFFNGNEFYYFVYQDYKDVRLVGAPPSSLGKFGGDTDNWEWPRHTADFAVFRVYSDANGNPAEFSDNNIPLKPKHHLPVSLKGYKEGDFAMILGYPGRTNRYLTSYGIEQLVDKDYPAWVEASKVTMDVLKKYMDADKATQLAYASQYASVANYWKNRAGTIEAVKKNGTVKEKQNLEKIYDKWANKKENKALFSPVLSQIKNYYQEVSNKSVERNYSSILQRNAHYISTTFQLGSLFKTYASQDQAGKDAMKDKVLSAIDKSYDGFFENVETDLLHTLVSLYQTKVSKEVGSKVLLNVDAHSLPSLAKSSIFANKQSALNFVNNPEIANLENDKLLQVVNSFVDEQRANVNKYAKAEESFAKHTRLFIDGLMKSQPNKKFYPDANSTMRLTYGKIDTLPKREGRNYKGITSNYYTDMDGLVAKYVKGDEEFDLPQKVMDLNKAKDYGQYAEKEGYLPVNFLSNNDITGGNSGSPVINANGHLIGIAFDGNSEALSGDIVYEPKLQRTINVDIRFVLWVIDKYAGATNIIEELTLVK